MDRWRTSIRVHLWRSAALEREGLIEEASDPHGKPTDPDRIPDNDQRPRNSPTPARRCLRVASRFARPSTSPQLPLVLLLTRSVSLSNEGPRLLPRLWSR